MLLQPPFWGAAARALPSLIDRVGEGDFVEPGCCMVPTIVDRLGASSFDVGNEATRWLQLERSGAQLGVELRETWRQLRARAGHPDTGALAPDWHAAGSDSLACTKLQQMATHQVEQVEHDALDHAVLALPGADPRRRAWLGHSATSAVWVSAWPDKHAWTIGREWVAIT